MYHHIDIVMVVVAVVVVVVGNVAVVAVLGLDDTMSIAAVDLESVYGQNVIFTSK